MDENNVRISRTIIRGTLTALMSATNEDEAAQFGVSLQNYVLQGNSQEAVYVFAYESWGVVESILRVGNVNDYSQIPAQAQFVISAISTIWGMSFRKFPYEMSRAFVDIFEKSDSITRKRLTWFSIPISKFLKRDVMDIAKEQLSSKRR